MRRHTFMVSQMEYATILLLIYCILLHVNQLARVNQSMFSDKLIEDFKHRIYS